MRRHVLQRYLVAYLFILPVLLLYVIFVLRPTVQTFWLAFYEWNGISIDREWVGLANFQRLLGDPIFWQALQHSLIWTVVVVAFNLGGRVGRGGAPGGKHPGPPALSARAISCRWYRRRSSPP